MGINKPYISRFRKKIRIVIFILLIFTGNLLHSQDKLYIDSLINLLKNEKVDSSKVNILNEISWEYSYSLPDKCIEYAKKAIILSEEINFSKGMADAYKNIGNSYKNQSLDIEAIENYKKAIEIYKKINFYEGIARSMNNIGLIKHNQAYYNESLEILLEALDYAELSKDKKTISLCYNNIGLVFYCIKEYDKALKYYNKSLLIKKELKDIKGITNCYNNIANIYADKKQYDSAKINYQLALDLLEVLNDLQGLVMANLNIAILYTETDNTELALPYLKTAIKLSEESNNVAGLCVAYTYMAIVLSNQRNFTQAELYADRALKYAEESNLRFEKTQVLKLYSDIFSQKKEFEKALKYYILYKDELDSLRNIKSQEKILELEAKYQTEKKEKEIEIKNILIEKQTSEIKFQTNTKYFFISLLGLIIVVAILLYRGIRIRNRNNKILFDKNIQIQQQKEEIERSNRNIHSSITYARRIQNSILPNKSVLNEFANESFILWKPRNVVSGDFYYIKKYNDFLFVSAADCTGHGVPGAFMSVLGITLINEIIRSLNITSSSLFLEEMRKQIKLSLQQTGQQGQQQDGMDIAFCVINLSNLEMSFAGANQPCYIFRKDLSEKGDGKEFRHLTILKADRQPVGIFAKERPFTEQKFQLQAGDVLYLFSDGYNSQFGGDRKEKYKQIRFQQLLTEICHLSLSEQELILENKFEEWKGKNEQTDDVMVLGMKI